LDWDKIPYDLSLAIYRICQEALTNIARYAGLKKPQSVSGNIQNLLVIQIEDKGIGFDLASIGKDSVGLIGIRERVRLLAEIWR